jgi:hypothetical protein
MFFKAFLKLILQQKKFKVNLLRDVFQKNVTLADSNYCLYVATIYIILNRPLNWSCNTQGRSEILLIEIVIVYSQSFF